MEYIVYLLRIYLGLIFVLFLLAFNIDFQSNGAIDYGWAFKNYTLLLTIFCRSSVGGVWI